jgi:hypothetical protein
MPQNRPPLHQQPNTIGRTQNWPRDQSWAKSEEPMRGVPINFLNAFEVVGFGAFCGATHSTFHVKKHPTYMSLMGLDLLFSLKIHINYIF